MTASSPIARHVMRLAALTFGLALSTAIVAAPPNSYQVHNLVSDVAGQADKTDLNLVNGWGIALGPTSPMWVSDNGTGKSTVYDGTGALKLTVTIPPVSGTDHGAPTGIVFNPGASSKPNDFLVAGAGEGEQLPSATQDT